MEPEMQVAPEALRRVAGDVELLREDFDRCAKDISSAAGELGRRMAGWRLARTGEDCAFGWRDDAKGIDGRLDGYVEALRRCARDYQYADRVSAEAFELFPPPW